MFIRDITRERSSISQQPICWPVFFFGGRGIYSPSRMFEVDRAIRCNCPPGSALDSYSHLSINVFYELPSSLLRLQILDRCISSSKESLSAFPFEPLCQAAKIIQKYFSNGIFLDYTTYQIQKNREITAWPSTDQPTAPRYVPAPQPQKSKFKAAGSRGMSVLSKVINNQQPKESHPYRMPPSSSRPPKFNGELYQRLATTSITYSLHTYIKAFLTNRQKHISTFST